MSELSTKDERRINKNENRKRKASDRENQIVNQTLLMASNYVSPDYTHILEFGVFRGKTLRLLNKLLGKTNKLFGFDTFTGLPEDWSGTNLMMGALSNLGNIPKIENVIFYKGLFLETIPDYIKIAEPIALLHVDCDLYSSTMDVLYLLNDYIFPGTVIVFDEWYYNKVDVIENRQHEQKAFYEWINDKKREFKLLDPIERERQIVLILN